MSVRQLPSGKWQAIVHVSLGSCMHKEEAESLVHAYEEDQKSRACTPAASGSLAAFLKPSQLALLHEYQEAKGIETLEKALAQVIAGWQRLYWQQRQTKAWAEYWAKIQPPKG